MLLRTGIVFLLTLQALVAAVPAPHAFFGHAIGADRTSLEWTDVAAYFQLLGKNSDRIRVSDVGKSTLGRPMIAAFISSPETIANLDEYRLIQASLADPRRTPEPEAEKLIAAGKTVVMVTCSIHSTEVASTHTAIEFAYKLLTEDTPKRRRILDNTILILVPSLNPDGVDIVTNWYRKTLGTKFEGTSPPELYHKYVGHDNNRDWYIFSQAETRHVVSQLHNRWHPQIVYDVHQQSPYASRMFVPPWMDPIDPNIDPIIAQQCNAIGMGMAADLTAAGKTGVVVNALYDFWTPARHYQAYHGGLRILSESASARLSSPIVVRPEQISERGHGYNPRESTWNHLQPWLGGEWRLRDIIDYQSIAMESLLYQAAVRRSDLLRAFYRIGQRAIERNRPQAFAVPTVQRDPGASKKLLETLSFGMVEIERARQRFESKGKTYPAGTYVIRMQQPYSSFAKTLLERQNYPDLRLYPGGPPKRPYDVTAHTLPLLMGVEVDTLETPVSAPLDTVSEFSFRLPSPSSGMAASDTGTWSKVNQAWDKKAPVWRDLATGDFYLNGGDGRRPVTRPRVGLYKSYVPSMDEGWTRWLLEEFGFAYTSTDNRRIAKGDLRRDFDVLLFPDQTSSTIANGYREGDMPAGYTGGLGTQGADVLRAFASGGGTLVFLNSSCEYAAKQLALPVKEVLKGLPASEFYSPGSLLNVRLNTKHPLSYGLPAEIAIWSQGSPAWTLSGDSREVAQYPREDILASGWLLGEKHLAGKSAIVDVPLGKGRVILFGMRPQYRAQSYQAFKLLFNALLY
ncbi:MAG: peptidase M14 [Bryobacteraceae bacterium]|nr:M14 family metallopeptidase [Bryobacterales bacterium]NUN02125.1 peptidase M14 [Bryobacteraceae bacterium]